MAARGVNKSNDRSGKSAKPEAARPAGDAEQVAKRARKAGKRAANKVAKAVSSTARRVAEAVTNTAQKVADAARGMAKKVAAVTTAAAPEPAPAKALVAAKETGGKKAGKATAKKGPAKKAAKKTEKAPAKAAAKQATGKKAAKKASAKAAGKQATGKKAAKKASAKAAGKAGTGKAGTAKAGAAKAGTAKGAGKGAAKAGTAKAAAKAAAKAVAPAASLTGPLGDWLARLNASIASLQADPRVDVVVNWQAPGATVEQLDAVEAKLGVKLGPAIRNFYQQVNGLALVWGPKGECPKPLRGRPKMMYMESLGGARGAIYMPPVGDVFGVRGQPEFDYAQFMDGAPSHWGFDFPGNFYTPAFVRVGDGLQVRVGDDHGAAWDGPTVSFERYLENVLASWGSIDERARQFVQGKGKPVAALPLAKLLA